MNLIANLNHTAGVEKKDGKGHGVAENDGYKKGNGGLFTTYLNTPGNTLPIVWGGTATGQVSNKRSWYSLYERVFNPLVPKKTNKRPCEKLKLEKCILCDSNDAGSCGLDT